ncbi:hypothetical protein [Alkalilacustris brevis]|nr:hypothetical protein [Alkalilacustris brevis]
MGYPFAALGGAAWILPLTRAYQMPLARQDPAVPPVGDMVDPLSLVAV